MRHDDENYYQTFRVEQYKTLLKRHKVSVIDDANQVKQAIKEAETTCHFSIWHVVATVSNHGYVLFMIQNIFDPAVFYTNTEWHAKYPNRTTRSIQKITEQTEIYITGLYSSSDEDHLYYCETRTECLQQLPSTIFTDNDMGVKDTLKFFKGDVTAIAFETDHQKGKSFPHSSCKIRADKIFNLAHSVYFN